RSDALIVTKGPRLHIDRSREQADIVAKRAMAAADVENLAILAKRKLRLVGLAFRGLMIWLACYVLLLAVSPAS
ncbi:hypothetical protein, partial [Halomonas sp. ND22Bw]|uniref:hypothetical protein n=1 Tax=Halomonas sp. ND22Bw TaxID=2054178 RepID=UPI001C636D27